MGTSWDLYCLDCESHAHVGASYDPIRQYELLPLIEVSKALTPDAAAAFAELGDLTAEMVSALEASIAATAKEGA